MTQSTTSLAFGAFGALCAMALLTLPVGCKTTSGEGESTWPSFRYRTCSDASPCPTGFDCRNNRCISNDSRFVMTTTECASREDCGYGMACIEAACVVDVIDCQSDFDCVGNQVCVDGTCTDKSSCVSGDDQPCYEFEHWND